MKTFGEIAVAVESDHGTDFRDRDISFFQMPSECGTDLCVIKA
ncbi:hypothetical protein [Mongoliibacter sp.]|nr:hypothetical protein [Mongoliibacter sp.]